MPEDPVKEWLISNMSEKSLLETDIKSRSFNSSANWDASMPIWKSPKLVLAEDNPFKNMKIQSTTELNRINGRSVCIKCNKSRKYYCYSCCVPLEVSKNVIPKVKSLPLKIDIIKHRKEIDGKSTATHAKVICPDYVNIYVYPDLPDFDLTQENVVLLFPGKNSKPLSKYVESRPVRKIDRVVFIDSTWNQTKAIYSDAKVRNLPTIVIGERETIFWRYQTGKPKEYMSTIEAIYYFLVDYSTIVLQEPYNGNYDNILFLFKFMFEKIHVLYDKSNLRRYQSITN